jgi:uncharacterized membrane protein
MLWKLGLYLLAAFFVAAGLNHFRDPAFYSPMMPPYIPAPALMISLSGAAELVLGLLLLLPRARPYAAWGLVLLLLAVFPANLHMYLERETTFAAIAPLALLLRLPFQLVLIAWAYLYTRKAP